MRYQKAPEYVEAIQWKGNNFEEIDEFNPINHLSLGFKLNRFHRIDGPDRHYGGYPRLLCIVNGDYVWIDMWSFVIKRSNGTFFTMTLQELELNYIPA